MPPPGLLGPRRAALLLALVVAAPCARPSPPSPLPSEPSPPRTGRSPPPQRGSVGDGLLQACALGREPIVDAVIRRERADPAYADERGYTCVHIAAQYGHTDVLRLLLEGHGLRERGLALLDAGRPAVAIRALETLLRLDREFAMTVRAQPC